MKGISTFNADYLADDYEVHRQMEDGRWMLARPEGKTGVIHRLKQAWKVFTGRADVLVWTGEQ